MTLGVQEVDLSVPDICDAVQGLQLEDRYIPIQYKGKFAFGNVCTVEFIDKQSKDIGVKGGYIDKVYGIPVLSGIEGNGAYCGSMIANHFKGNILVNGYIRDIDEMNNTIGIGYKGVRGYGNSMYYKIKQIGYPMEIKTNMGYFTITSDDMVFMDQHGAIFIERKHLNKVFDYIQQRKAIDLKIEQLLLLGLPWYLAVQQRHQLKSKL